MLLYLSQSIHVSTDATIKKRTVTMKRCVVEMHQLLVVATVRLFATVPANLFAPHPVHVLPDIIRKDERCAVSAYIGVPYSVRRRNPPKSNSA